MNTKELKFLPVAAVVAVSFGLAGCGGGRRQRRHDPHAFAARDLRG